MEENKIGKAIKKYRELKGISQTELATLIGLAGKDVISKYERGERLPTLEKNLPAICNALDIEFDVVFKKKHKKSPV